MLLFCNWKTHIKKLKAADQLLDLVYLSFQNAENLAIFPPILYLNLAERKLKNSLIKLGGQYVFEENIITGNVTADMYEDIGCKYCIVGHSETRKLFQESNSSIKKKVDLLAKNRITPVLCIGETLDIRKKNLHIEFLRNQIQESLPTMHKNIIIAYEPVWAIGTGLIPTQKQIAEVIELVKSLTSATFMYGGSVNESNIYSLTSTSGLGGILLGKAGTNINQLTKIYEAIS